MPLISFSSLLELEVLKAEIIANTPSFTIQYDVILRTSVDLLNQVESVPLQSVFAQSCFCFIIN
jgi:hypothetical protein